MTLGIHKNIINAEQFFFFFRPHKNINCFSCAANIFLTRYQKNDTHSWPWANGLFFKTTKKVVKKEIIFVSHQWKVIFSNETRMISCFWEFLSLVPFEIILKSDISSINRVSEKSYYLMMWTAYMAAEITSDQMNSHHWHPRSNRNDNLAQAK